MNDVLYKEFEKFAKLWGYNLERDEDDYYFIHSLTQRVWDAFTVGVDAQKRNTIVELPSPYNFPDGVNYLDQDIVIFALEQSGVNFK